MRTIAMMVASILLAACATSGEQSDRGLEKSIYERHAGAAETWVRYTSVRNWWAVGYQSVVFELDRSRHYLVNLTGPCGLELGTSASLRLDNDRRNVLSEFDRIYVRNQSCQIHSIRRVDLASVRKDLEAESLPMPEGQGDVDQDQSSGGT